MNLTLRQAQDDNLIPHMRENLNFKFIFEFNFNFLSDDISKSLP